MRTGIFGLWNTQTREWRTEGAILHGPECVMQAEFRRLGQPEGVTFVVSADDCPSPRRDVTADYLIAEFDVFGQPVLEHAG